MGRLVRWLVPATPTRQAFLNPHLKQKRIGTMIEPALSHYLPNFSEKYPSLQFDYSGLLPGQPKYNQEYLRPRANYPPHRAGDF